MKYKLLFITGLIISLFYSCSIEQESFEVYTDHLKISINNKGFISEFIDLNSSSNYIVKDTSSPILSIRVAGKIFLSQQTEFNKDLKQIKLFFSNNVEAIIGYKSNKSHIKFEVLEISNLEEIEMIIWGPYQTSISKTIGETIGVVQGEDFTLGLQALNPKTIGGYPWTDNDCMPQINMFAQDDFTDMSEANKEYVLYRVEAAKPTNKGSSLQAYCRNRTKDRLIQNLNHEKYIAPAFNDKGIIGSKIAIFGVPVNQTLKTIGQIEIEEGLPHPQLNGDWAKISTEAASAYIIMGFGKDNIRRAIDITKKAGLKYLYHDGPFESWGHFKLRKDQFPNGINDLKYCVDQAAENGIYMGLHTLSNFITTNDEYVTPIPDPRLGKVGYSILTNKIDKAQKEIQIESPDFFKQFKNNHLKTVQIDNELIRYGGISSDEPWILQDCERGAFGTTADFHKEGDTISKLIDHGYKVFLTDASLGMEVAENITELYNQTGLRQISFDGLEGNRSTGMGNYGEILFTQAWFNKINNDIKSHYIADASRTSHYFWHMYTRMNWGEPWYAGFRESQTEYRLKNQAYFKRNLMPGMLGWFRMTDQTSIEDIEWMLARSAAFDAGYAFVIDYTSLEKNQHSEEILHLIGEWEKIRMGQLLSAEQKVKMEDVSNEYHLRTIDINSWALSHINSVKLVHKKMIRQPGEPTHSTFMFNHDKDETPFQFNITARNGNLEKITIEIDNYKTIEIPEVLKAGETLIFAEGNKGVIYNQNWAKRKEVDLEISDFQLSKGEHSLLLKCEFPEEEDVELHLELRLISKTERIQQNINNQ